MPASLLSFKVLPNKTVAQDFADVLQQQSIDYTIEEDSLVFDPSYTNNELNKEYIIKIRQQDFPRASKAFENYFASQVDHIDPAYYLFSFTTEELKDIVTKPDEWGSLDYQLALKLLKERGVVIAEEERENLKAKRNEELAKPEKENSSTILSYYIVSLLLFPVGMIIGWVWTYSKKTLPSGRRVHAYDEAAQKHGRRILTIATILFILTIITKLTGTSMNKLY